VKPYDPRPKEAREHRKYITHKRLRVGEPSLATLRAYREHHPSLRVFVVERNGRTVWLTFKQLQILHYIDRSEHRNRKLRLADIAKACGCSVSSVSRTLVRFDLWRFIDYVTLVGRRGGAWVQTRIARHQEQDANLARAKHTLQSRKVARSWLATQIRLREYRLRRLLKMRPKAPPIRVVTTGSMDAMFM
jgi:AraC-like DNA-binding protein